MITEQTIRAAFAFEFAEIELMKARGELPTPRAQEPIIQRMRSALNVWFKRQYSRIRAQALSRLDKLAKAEDDWDIEDPSDDLLDLFVQLEQEAAAAGAASAASRMGVHLGETPQEALDYARDRAGELVGKKWVDGDWVDNPDARWAIDDSLREDVNDLVTQAVDEGWSADQLSGELDASFEDWRADMIARTEIGSSYGGGTAQMYADNGVDYVEILDGPGCLPDGHDDSAPEPGGEPGEIEDDAQANGQVWTIEQYQDNLLGHPNCVRAAVPYVGATPEETDNAEDED